MMKAFRHVQNHYHVSNPQTVKTFSRFMHTDAISNHSLSESESLEWYDRAFPKLIKLSDLVKGLDLINGRLVDVQNRSVVDDKFLMQCMLTFKSTGATFVMQNMRPCAHKPVYKQPFAIDSIKKICAMLVVLPHQRRFARQSICAEVTQHQIWTGALMKILNQLKHEMRVRDHGCTNKHYQMAQQILVNCLRFLNDLISYDSESTSWMRVKPKKDADSPPPAKWADLLEMFNDLIMCLKFNHEFLFYVLKLEIMKEGLFQIKDVLADKNIGYKHGLHHQSLVRKKLTKSLGHSSQCLFTLLSYYLHRSIQDIEVDNCWFSKVVAGNKVCLCLGKIMTSDDEKMLMHVVKQLDRALGAVKFVHEMMKMDNILEFEGHLWCLGSKSRSIVYRGRNFFIHGISLQ